ncbi:MAG: hypothetical protein PUA68_06235 [Bacilli bacterium]|nr:hypothetical protein [Bacilli bacterium]
MYYGIYDEDTITKIKPLGKKPIVIRLLDKDKEPLENFDNVLKLFVADINRELDLENIYNEKHAKMINDFILNNDFDEILVHCALGISRSPAVMAYIALILDDKKMFNDILSEKHFILNKLILRKSMEYDYIIKKDNREKISRNKFNDYEDLTEYDPITKTLTFKL